MNQGYTERLPEDYNLLLVEDYDGTRASSPERITLSRSSEMRFAETATVRVENYEDHPVTMTRSLLFARAGGMLMRDSVVFYKGFSARIGDSFRVKMIGPEIGESWVNTYLGDTIPVRGIGKGAPIYARWKNPKRDLLIFFAPHDDRALEVSDISPEDPTSVLPQRVRYEWRGKGSTSQVEAFTTLLLPHDPIRNPATLARSIHVLVDDASSSVVRVDDSQGGSQWFILNEEGRPLKTGSLETDARQAYLRVEAGQIVTCSAHEAAFLSLGGKVALKSARRVTWSSASP